MTAVDLTLATYTQNKSGGGLCYYKPTITYKVSSALNDLSSYVKWLTVTPTDAQILVADAEFDNVDSIEIAVTVVVTLNDVAVTVNEAYTFTAKVVKGNCDTAGFNALSLSSTSLTVE